MTTESGPEPKTVQSLTGVELDGHIPEDLTPGENEAYNNAAKGQKGKALLEYRVKNGLATWQEMFAYTWKKKYGSDPRELRQKDKTLLGAGAVYDRDGKLITNETGFFSGKLNKGMGEEGLDHHVERRIIRWFESKGLLRPGNTLVITVNGEQGPCKRDNSKGCDAFLMDTHKRTGTGILYERSGGNLTPYGMGEDDAGQWNGKAAQRFNQLMNSKHGLIAYKRIFNPDGTWGDSVFDRYRNRPQYESKMRRFGRSGVELLFDIILGW